MESNEAATSPAVVLVNLSDVPPTEAPPPADAQTGHAVARFIATLLTLVVLNLLVIVGNCLVIAVVFTYPKLRSVTNIFIVSLAVSDLLLGFVVLPFSTVNELVEGWKFGYFWCRTWLIVDAWLCTTSILNLCAISIDRYLAVSRPIRYPTLMTKSRVWIGVGAVWTLALLICVPQALWTWSHVAMPTVDGILESIFDPEATENGTVVCVRGREILNAAEFNSSRLNGNYPDLVKSHTLAYVNDKLDQVRWSKSGAEIRSDIFHSLPPPDSGPSSSRPVPAVDGLFRCSVISDPLYVIYSSCGAFWIPVIIIVFFYVRIYHVAIAGSRAVRRGIVASSSGRSVTSRGSNVLRVHRGGGACCDGAGGTRGAGIVAGSGTTSVELIKLRPLGEPTALDIRRNTAQSYLVASTANGQSEGSVSPANKSSAISQTNIAFCLLANETGTDGGLAESPQSLFNHNTTLQTLENVSLSATHDGQQQVDTPVLRDDVMMTIGRTATASPMGGSNRLRRSTSNEFLTVQRRLAQLAASLVRLNREKRAVKTVGIVVGCFVLCWAPFFTVYVVRAYCLDCVSEQLLAVFTWLGYGNSAVNPFIYAFCSRHFRQAFRQLVTCNLHRRRVARGRLR